MKLQINKTEETAYHPFLLKVLEDIAGGVMVTAADLKTTTEELKAGAIIGEDGSIAGKYHLCKTAKVYEAVAAGATAVKANKNHEFKAGDFITNGQVSTAITSIVTSNANYDTINLTATLDATEAVPIDTVLYQGSSETSNAATASEATVEGVAEDYLTVANPRGTTNDIIVTISQNGSDALSVTYTPSTRTLAIALANSTAASNNAAAIQAAIRALAQSGGVDFTDWTATGDGWDGNQTGATLTDPSHRMSGGVPKPDYLAPKYVPCAITNTGLDVSGDSPNVMTGAVTRGTVKESLLPFAVHSHFKTLLTDRIKFV